MSKELTAHELMDQELVDTIRERLESNRQALHDLRGATRQLEMMNRKLQESESLKSHFLSNIRNEINNPLTSIMGLSRQLIAKPDAVENTALVGPMIYLEAFNLDFQLQNIFVAAELEAGEALPAYARVDVSGVIEAVLELLVHQISRKNIVVNKRFPAPLVFISDAHKLQVILKNLLSNALEYSPEGGEVEVSAELQDEDLFLAVRDAGIGIDPEHQDRVFDRFKQLESGATKSHPGHGLGLSVCKSLVELMGGSISLNSAPSCGCRVEVSFPVVTEEVNVTAQDSNVFLFDEPEEF